MYFGGHNFHIKEIRFSYFTAINKIRSSENFKFPSPIVSMSLWICSSFLNLLFINRMFSYSLAAWADNADFCSKQYAGTGALKTDFTRTGKRTVFGALQDGINSAIRYYKNNFSDGFRQVSLIVQVGHRVLLCTLLPRVTPTQYSVIMLYIFLLNI